MVNRLTLLLSILLLLSGCSQKEPEKKIPVAAPKADSTQIAIALLPTLDCLPFYYAAQQHIYDSLGLSVRFPVYRSQMDAEQSVIDGKTSGCATDLFRTGWMQGRKIPVRFLFATNREWQLIGNKVLRISNIAQINDRMIGMTRNSVPDYITDFVVSKLKKNSQALRAQVNNLAIRQQMMENNQIEIAILPQPQALTALKDGHTALPLARSTYEGFSGLALSTRLIHNPAYKDKTGLLLKGYNEAVKRLTKNDRLTLPPATVKQFMLTEVVDSIHAKKAFSKARTCMPEKVSTALHWLQARGLVSKSYRADTLLYNN